MPQKTTKKMSKTAKIPSPAPDRHKGLHDHPVRRTVSDHPCMQLASLIDAARK